MTDQLPNFLILGAQKCGTTWLHEQLTKHPQFFMSNTKEIHFFNMPRAYGKGLDFYKTFFQGADGKKFIGESTPNYFWTSKVPVRWLGAGVKPFFMQSIPERIANDLGSNTKFVLLLRNPVDRAISAFYHHLKFDGRMDLSLPFEENIKSFGIAQMGFYARHLLHFLNFFPRNQFLVLIYEEFFAAPEAGMQKIMHFLGADQDFDFGVLENRIHSGKGKNEIDNEYYFSKKNEENPTKIISKSNIELLKSIYKKPNNLLREVLQKDLRHWD